ncbi:MAG: RNA methyltransferase [Sediminibacterium sp.]|nr:RNA methyltransferase [Sediminibacterium sp.]
MTEERTQKIESVLQKRQANLTVVMENIFNPHNIAAVMRTCDSVGIQDLYVVNTILPPYKFIGKKTSSSADKWITMHNFNNLQDCVKVLRNNYKKIYATHLSKQANSIYDVDLTDSMAIVFGNEGTGVSEEMISLCDGNLFIPQIGMIQSLNISVACAVILYESFRQKSIKGCYNTLSLSTEKYTELYNNWKKNKKNDHF